MNKTKVKTLLQRLEGNPEEAFASLDARVNRLGLKIKTIKDKIYRTGILDSTSAYIERIIIYNERGSHVTICNDIVDERQNPLQTNELNPLDRIKQFARNISYMINNCEPDYFKKNAYKIWETLNELNQINLIEALDDKNAVKRFQLNSIDDLKDEAIIFPKIINKFWYRYSKAFILQQRIDSYELQRNINFELKDYLENLSEVLRQICSNTAELFEITGLVPHKIEFFKTTFDDSIHDSTERFSLLRDEHDFNLLLKSKVDEAHEKGLSANGMIYDILELGYNSSFGSEKSDVARYQDTEGSYSRLNYSVRNLK
ncbi:MAG: hypothetical protein ACOYT4_04715 [Nanoarchaeota archaeon]